MHIFLNQKLDSSRLFTNMTVNFYFHYEVKSIKCIIDCCVCSMCSLKCRLVCLKNISQEINPHTIDLGSK